MPAKPLTVTVPEPLLKLLRGRARRAKRTVEAEVIQLLTDAVSAGDEAPPSKAAHQRNGQPKIVVAKEEEALPPDIEAAIAEVERLDEDGLRKAVVPLMKPKQARRLEALNRKAQDEGLSAAEERERDELSHLYDKSMIVRATAFAELHKRGVNVNELLAP